MRFLIFLILLFPYTLQALPPVRVNVLYYANGKDTLSLLSALYMVKQVQDFYKREFNLRLRFKNFYVKELKTNSCQTMTGLKDYSCWNIARKDSVRIRSKQRLTLAIMPPIFEKDVKWFAGYGDMDSYRYFKGLALAHCSDWSSLGLDRNAACGLVSAHELGHNMGLWHCDVSNKHCIEPNFMRGDAGNFANIWGWNWPVVWYNRLQLNNYFYELERL